MSRRRLPLKLVAPAVLLAVAGLGGGIALLPSSGVEVQTVAPSRPGYHPGDPPRRLDRFGQMFLEGVQYLSAGRHHEAVMVFSEATRLRPHLPEAFVNLGFAHLGAATWLSARRAFERAIELRADQVNAYYGLAMALEELGELEGAVGAMRTYLHLAPKDTAHHRKASAALWEWEDALRVKRGGQPLDTRHAVPIPERR